MDDFDRSLRKFRFGARELEALLASFSRFCDKEKKELNFVYNAFQDLTLIFDSLTWKTNLISLKSLRKINAKN